MTRPAPAGSKAGGPVLGMLLKGYPRISETFIAYEILRLEELGFTVRIISMRRARENFHHEMVSRIKAPVDYLPTDLEGNRLTLYTGCLRALLANPKGWRAAWKLYRQRRREGGGPATWKHFLQGCYVAGRLAKEKGKPALTHLHAHFAHSPTSVTQFAALAAGLHFSFTAHAKDVWTQAPDRLAAKLAAADFVVTCTRANARYLASLNTAGTPIHTIYHGIDLHTFALRPPKPSAPPYAILTVARFTTKKGLPTVLRALALLRAQGIDFRYTLIGDGEDREAVTALVNELGLDDVTSLTGTQPHDRVCAELTRADLFVLGCQVADNGDRDGIPNVLVEAMAVGVPVAATNVSALPELVRDEETGLAVPPENPDALATAMRRLLTDAELRERLIPEARKLVAQEFDNRANARTLAKVFASHGLGPNPDSPRTS